MVVNVIDIRNDAIIVTNSNATSIKLSRLTEAETRHWIEEGLTTYMRHTVPIEKREKDKRYVQLLSWLWSSCVEVIAEIFGGKRAASDRLPRAWWIGVGIANYLSFHTAGDHSGGSTDDTLSWPISSYTLTINALAHARRNVSATTKTCNAKARLLVVPHTPGETDFPGVEREELKIQMTLPSTVSIQSLVHPDANTVLEQLADRDMIHFAGHGMSDHVDPFKSGLLLQAVHGAVKKKDKLSVRQISDAHLKGASMAYLSACSTAENRARTLLDKVIHLASGFQMAGFPMWWRRCGRRRTRAAWRWL